MRLSLAIVVISLTSAVMAQRAVIVDDKLVGYGLQRCETVPPALQGIMDMHVRAEGQKGQARVVAVGSAEHRRASIRRKSYGEAKAVVPPLLQSIRDQAAPYNWLCPRWTDTDGNQSTENCLSGCVAASIEQVMAYYRYPEALTDTLHGWQTPNYVIDDMFPGTRFDWDNYLQDYRNGYTETQGLAIALPTLAAGMAVHMRYGLESSGANLYSAVEPLRNAFGYGYVRHLDRVMYTPERWHELLQYELLQGRPVAYTGHTMSLAGHAFNIDGVDQNGYYHVNWGYNGNYDGYFDLDWLAPWETTDRDSLGFALAFFCNQGMLCMHPQADVPFLEPDTLDIDSLGVKLDSISFVRQPATRGYVPADFYFHNEGSQAVTYTYEVMTFLPTDTAVFLQADYVGLSRVQLEAGEHQRQRIYLAFDEAGDRILGISHDDATIPFQQQVSIEAGTRPILEWGSVSMDLTDDVAVFTVPVSNSAASGVAGDLVSFCLVEDGHFDDDPRHFTVLNLPAGETTQLKVLFSALQPSTTYHFLVRCPWEVQTELTFTTPSTTGIADVSMPYHNVQAPSSDNSFYDLSGRKAAPLSRGVMITKGRKFSLW